MVVMVGVDDLDAMEELADLADANLGFALRVDDDHVPRFRSLFGKLCDGGHPDLIDGDQSDAVLRPPESSELKSARTDMDYPALARQNGSRAVGLLLVPAWDFGADRLWHARMAFMRGVEDGFTVARVAKNG
ncbi:MAG: hypothetical protein ACRD2G_10525 [Terriglobia bacterium]